MVGRVVSQPSGSSAGNASPGLSSRTGSHMFSRSVLSLSVAMCRVQHTRRSAILITGIRPYARYHPARRSPHRRRRGACGESGSRQPFQIIHQADQRARKQLQGGARSARLEVHDCVDEELPERRAEVVPTVHQGEGSMPPTEQYRLTAGAGRHERGASRHHRVLKATTAVSVFVFGWQNECICPPRTTCFTLLLRVPSAVRQSLEATHEPVASIVIFPAQRLNVLSHILSSLRQVCVT
eukprot:COSAG02_NODE_1787_length_10931_cov_2.224889_2_plen_239_part_00